MATTGRRGEWIWGGVAAAWLALVLGGTAVQAMTKREPGQEPPARAAWPAWSRLERAPGRPAIVMIAHPMCPCTRASLAELNKLAHRVLHRATVLVLFVRPEGAGEDWASSDLWERARQIPGATVVVDEGGVEAKRFGAFTSGQTFLFGADGALVFEGGITIARGHQGDSTAAALIASYVDRGEGEFARGPVFGCDLENPERAAAVGR